MRNNEPNWEKLGYVLASEYRIKIIRILKNGPQRPKDIALGTGMYLSHVSNILKGLQEKGLVRCLTPRLKRGRLYSLTDEGKKVAQHLKN